MIIQGSFEPVLVVLSVIIAIAASYTALDLAGRIRASSGRARQLWLGAAALAMGGGVWSMHFVAMLAFVLPIPVAYNVWVTALSLVVAVLVTGTGLAIVSLGQPTLPRIGIAGLFMGAGICSMHYIGMAAMRMAAGITYDPAAVAASFLIGAGASVIGLWLAFNVDGLIQRIAAALAMGGAVAGMHYTGMAAVTCSTDRFGSSLIRSTDLPQLDLALAVSVITFLILVFAVVSSAIDRRVAAIVAREAAASRDSEERYRHLYTALQQETVEREHAERFRLVVESAPNAMLMVDGSGLLTLVNIQAERLFGYGRAELLGRPVEMLVPDRFRAQHTGLRRGFFASASARPMGAGRDLYGLRKDGTEVPIEIGLNPIEAAGTMFVLASIIDITERKRSETALRDLMDHLEARVKSEVTAREASQAQLAQAQKVQALGQLAGGIAHDFNNILQTVAGAATLIEQQAEDPQATRRLALMAFDAVSRGTSITRRLLSFARRGELHAEPIDTTELLTSMGEILTHTLGGGVIVRVLTESDLPWILADRGQLETALVNLASNARDAMPGGGTLTISAASELVHCDGAHPAGLRPGRYVRIAVTDTGVGVDAEILARVTEPFFTTKPPGRGTGLGLSMVRGFVEQSGGRLLIQSDLGTGTTVTLWLRETDAALGGRPNKGMLSTHSASARSPNVTRILLVDDDDLVRETLAAQLERMGYVTLVACGGAEAVALLDAGEAVDALVSDLLMPKINGIETIRRARQSRPGLHCFLLTGYAEEEILPGDSEFTLIRKPTRARELMARIEASLAADRNFDGKTHLATSVDTVRLDR